MITIILICIIIVLIVALIRERSLKAIYKEFYDIQKEIDAFDESEDE